MYIHTDIFAAQSSKKSDQPCGDAWGVFRNENATTFVLADGLGSGVKANIAANLCVSRMLTLVRMGLSIRETFNRLSATMDTAWGTVDPFSVFTIAQILNNGRTTILSYEMPPPLIISRSYAQVLNDRVYTREKAVVHESNCVIEKGEGLMLMSDGITQAGIGKLFTNGWESEGVCNFLQTHLNGRLINGNNLAQLVHNQARSYWPNNKGDDCSVVVAVNRRGVVVNLLSGPPLRVADDEDFVHDFYNESGIHIISGGSTSKMAARVMNRAIDVVDDGNALTPPSFKMKGTDLITEGMVTLNQVCNLLDEDLASLPTGSPAYEMTYFLKMADKVNIWMGMADNVSEDRIEFRQQGLLSRHSIIKRIESKLLQQGKLVVLNSL